MKKLKREARKVEIEKKHHDCPTCTCEKPLWKTKEEVLAMREHKREDNIGEPIVLDTDDGFVEIMS
ncbi:MAG: hypothetical protein AAB397_00190 [Patescibacteria group bacterium]